MTEVCSFSAVNDSLLMWAHYADNYKGLCIEYDLESLNADDPFRKDLHPVKYSNQFYDLRPFAENLIAKDRQSLNPFYINLCVMHKHTGWEYEQEWRMIKHSDANTAGRALSAPTPSGVFLGSMFDEIASRELLDICKREGIAIYKMHLALDRFELLPESFAE
jgi:hypothetical protein